MGQSYWGNGRNRAQVQNILIKAVSSGREPHVLAYQGNQVKRQISQVRHVVTRLHCDALRASRSELIHNLETNV